MKLSSQTQVEEYSLWNIALDALLICASISSPIILICHGKTFHRGFFCNDESIRYPYKSSTVHIGLLFGVSLFIAFFTIVALELWLAWRDEGRRRRVALVAGWAMPEWALRVVRHFFLYVFGMFSEELLVNVGKFTVGRLRPHFLDVCKPNVLCNASDPSGYIQNYECTGQDEFLNTQSGRSFPSGHTTMAFYTAVFVAYYLERRIRWPQRAIVLKTAAQLLLMATAWFTALSRLQDHKHHWEDVAAGGVLGTLVALFWVRRVLRVGADEAQSSGASETTFVFPADAPQKMETALP